MASAVARIPLWRAVIFALSALPVTSGAAVLLIYLPPHLATQLGVPLGVIAGVWLVVRLIDIGLDPILGMLMDRTRTRIGRYRPWMLAGAPIFSLGIGMLFFTPSGIGTAYMVGWLLVLYVGLSILSLAPPAWASTIARTYDERSRIFGVMAAVAIAALLVTLAIPAFTGQVLKLGDAAAVHAMGVFLVVLTPVAVGLAVWMTPEPLAPKPKAAAGFAIGDLAAVLRRPALIRLYAAQMAMVLGPGWMSSIFLFFAKDYMHFTGGQASLLLMFYVVAGLAGAPTTAWLATRIGKHRAVMAVAIAYSLGLLTVLLPPKGVFWASIPVNLWCGFAGAGFELTIRSMLADVADEARLQDGVDRLSLIFSLNTAASKVASAVAIMISYRLLQGLGYVPRLGHANSAQAIRGLGLTFVSGPILCVILGAACMIGWRMTAARHAEVRTALDARDAAAALGVEGEAIADAAALERLGAA
jgi:Na+/melibiose symporter-like transporter